MTVINPNDNFSGKKEEHIFQKYGEKHTSNIKWGYDFRILRKWVTIILGAMTVATSTWMIREEVLRKEKEKIEKIQAEQERNKYLERRLETIKKETIAAEKNKIKDFERKMNVDAPVKPQKRGPLVYTWVNDKGDTVYSNKPRVER